MRNVLFIAVVSMACGTGVFAAAGVNDQDSFSGGSSSDTSPSSVAMLSNGGCSLYTTCYDCTADATTEECGWCPNFNGGVGGCFVGTGQGPTNGQCATSWAWTYTQCAASAPNGGCSAYTTCYDCTTTPANGNCGWCPNSNGGIGACLVGIESGPTNGQCSMSWEWDNDQCATTPAPNGGNGGCSAYTACHFCTADATSGECGWCPNSNGGAGGCFVGTQLGPSNGQCATSWAWNSDQCAAPVTPAPSYPPGDCLGYSNCTACTEFSSDCGWCSNQVGCRKGSESGPNDGDCSGSEWTWRTSTCGVSTAIPTPIPNEQGCRQYSTCAICLEQCGWCGSTSTCLSGSVSGSDNGQCTAAQGWNWDSPCAVVTPAPPSYGCAAHSTSCTACVNSPSGHCGFCSSTGVCASGDYSGPTTGSCPSSAWDWYSSQC